MCVLGCSTNMHMFFSGKVITLSDMSNTKAHTKCGPGNDLHALTDDLRRDPSLRFSVMRKTTCSEFSTRTRQCRRHMPSFPEILFVDATHKLTNLCMPLYVFLLSDGNGRVKLWRHALSRQSSVSLYTGCWPYSNHTTRHGRTLASSSLTRT